MKPSVAVIGAGWSGLAAAVTLADGGARVTLIDAAPQVGGRARRVDVTLGDRTFALDNGQHLLIGAYGEYLALARRVGVDVGARFLVQPFALAYPDGFCLQAADAPAPLHLASALLFGRGLTWRERLAATLWVQRWKARNWTLDAADAAALGLFDGHPAVLVERLWQPLCLAALNVRLADASARMFLRVLADSLGAAATASHLYVPREHLSAVLPDAAETTLRASGAEILLREPVSALVREKTTDPWTLELRGRARAVDAVVLALPPPRAAALLASANHADLQVAVSTLQAIETAPIATVYLRYPNTKRLSRPVLALDEAPAGNRFGQWVFDRGQLDPACAGVLSVVVSGRGAHEALGADALAGHVAAQLDATLRLGTPTASTVLTEKRATIVPRPGLTRPPVVLPATGLFLAGDSADSPYPSTLEGSVRAGIAAARAALAQATVSAA